MSDCSGGPPIKGSTTNKHRIITNLEFPNCIQMMGGRGGVCLQLRGTSGGTGADAAGQHPTVRSVAAFRFFFNLQNRVPLDDLPMRCVLE